MTNFTSDIDRAATWFALQRSPDRSAMLARRICVIAVTNITEIIQSAQNGVSATALLRHLCQPAAYPFDLFATAQPL